MTKQVITILALFIFIRGTSQVLPEFKTAIQLSGAINSSAQETKPVFSATGNEMYFVRAYHPANVGYEQINQNQDIWKATSDQRGGWNTAQNVESLNDEKDNLIIEVTENGNFFIQNVHKVKHHLVSGISEVSYVNNVWSEPKPINFPIIDHIGDFTDFYLTPDGKTLIISMVKDYNRMDEDLYVANLVDGKWSEAVNLGNSINTKGYEFAPYLSENKVFLFFSTNGRADGFGQGDVYISERLDDTWKNWSEPRNLGDVVNSPKMDGYFTISPDGKFYVSSNRGEGDDFDIYELSQEIIEKKVITDVVIVEGYVRDKLTSDSLNVPIVIENLESGDKVKVSSNRKGFYAIKLRKGVKYKFKIVAGGYQEYTEIIETPSVEDGIDEYWNHIDLLKYEKGVKIELNNLYFMTSTAILTNESEEPLKVLVSIMTQNPTMKIQIEGHTDNTGSEIANLALSEKRAETVKKMLIQYGIKKNRVKIKGYGSSRPLVKNLSEENKKKNRRVEFVIL